MPNKSAPASLTLADVLAAPVPQFNNALEVNRPDPDIPSKVINYTASTDEGLASRRSKHAVRTHAELAAATSGSLPLGEGLSLRMAMAGQGENDQWPARTNAYGKQRN